jgi:hypothetical protein
MIGNTFNWRPGRCKCSIGSRIDFGAHVAPHRLDLIMGDDPVFDQVVFKALDRIACTPASTSSGLR